MNKALQVSGDWTWGHASSERPAPEPGVELPFNHRLIFHEKDERQKFASLEEVAQVSDCPYRKHHSADFSIMEHCYIMISYPSQPQFRLS